MTDFSFSQMYEEAQSAESSEQIPAGDLPGGEWYRVRADFVKATTTSKGSPKLLIKTVILEGPHRKADAMATDGVWFPGDFMWDEITFSVKKSPEAASWNQAQIKKLKAMGLTDSFLTAKPTQEAVAQALQGQEYSLRPRWERTKRDDGQGVWINARHSYASVEEGPDQLDLFDDDDDDEEF